MSKRLLELGQRTIRGVKEYVSENEYFGWFDFKSAEWLPDIDAPRIK